MIQNLVLTTGFLLCTKASQDSDSVSDSETDRKLRELREGLRAQQAWDQHNKLLGKIDVAQQYALAAQWTQVRDDQKADEAQAESENPANVVSQAVREASEIDSLNEAVTITNPWSDLTSAEVNLQKAEYQRYQREAQEERDFQAAVANSRNPQYNYRDDDSAMAQGFAESLAAYGKEAERSRPESPRSEQPRSGSPSGHHASSHGQPLEQKVDDSPPSETEVLSIKDVPTSIRDGFPIGSRVIITLKPSANSRAAGAPARGTILQFIRQDGEDRLGVELTNGKRYGFRISDVKLVKVRFADELTE